jgi:hypothetical protein
LIFDVGNLFMANMHEPTPETWMPHHRQSHDLVAVQLPQ